MKVNHLDIVQQMHARQPPTSGSLDSCFQFQRRVLEALARVFPAEGWGYLKKGGENTTQFNGQTIKVGRVCGPDSQLYKIMTDIPTTNDPIWNDDGILTVDFPGTEPGQWWMPFEGAAVPVPTPDPVPGPTPTPTPSPAPSPNPDLMTAVQAVLVQVNIQANLIATMSSRMEALFVDMQARTNELKAILGQPQHYDGTVRIPYLGSGAISIDRKG